MKAWVLENVRSVFPSRPRRVTSRIALPLALTMPLMYQIPCRSHVSRLPSAYSKSPRARESIVRSRSGDNPHTVSGSSGVLITASSGAARPKASAPRRLVPRAVYNTSKYTATYGEGRTEDRAPRSLMSRLPVSYVSLSTNSIFHSLLRLLGQIQ